MQYYNLFIVLLLTNISFGQAQRVAGTYSKVIPAMQVRFNPDSTFEWATNEQHPTFHRWEAFAEKGRWTLAGDTIILNPHLAKKPYVESAFTEEELPGDTSLTLRFSHIKRYFDTDGKLMKTDTLTIDQLDYACNELKRENLTGLTIRLPFVCYFGPNRSDNLPAKRTSHSLSIKRPPGGLLRIFIGCNELQQTKEFAIQNPKANQLTFTVYSNYYGDGQIRQRKFLIKNDKIIYTMQKENGEFEKDNSWNETDERLRRVKDGG